MTRRGLWQGGLLTLNRVVFPNQSNKNCEFPLAPGPTNFTVNLAKNPYILPHLLHSAVVAMQRRPSDQLQFMTIYGVRPPFPYMERLVGSANME